MSQLVTSGGQSIGALKLQSQLSNEYSGLISFRIDWFELFGVQGTLKSLLQHHSSKASILHMLSRLVITFLSRRKSLLISSLQSPFAVTLDKMVE